MPTAPPNARPLFQLKGLSRDFTLLGKTLPVLSRLSLEIPEGS